VRSVRTSDIVVRVGAWEWTEATKAPSWETLQKAPLWKTEKAKMFSINYGRSRHSVQVMPHTDSAEQALKVMTDDRKTNVLMFNGVLETITPAVAEMKVRAIVWHAVPHKGALKIPSHVMGLVEEGCPLLIWGKKSMTENAVRLLREMFQLYSAVSIALFERPALAPVGSKYRDVEFSAVVFAPEKTFHTQVSFPLHSPTLSFLLSF
jgi:hypothetical protein